MRNQETVGLDLLKAESGWIGGCGISRPGAVRDGQIIRKKVVGGNARRWVAE